MVACTIRMWCVFFCQSRRRHTRCYRDWSSDVCSSDLAEHEGEAARDVEERREESNVAREELPDRKSTRLNSSHGSISSAVFCLNTRCHTCTRQPSVPAHTAFRAPSLRSTSF